MPLKWSEAVTIKMVLPQPPSPTNTATTLVRTPASQRLKTDELAGDGDGEGFVVTARQVPLGNVAATGAPLLQPRDGQAFPFLYDVCGDGNSTQWAHTLLPRVQ
eukprot:SAG11_NODE_23720_length_384_cov_0.624561_1_plen_103_part_01